MVPLQERLPWTRLMLVPALMLAVAGLQLVLSERGLLHRWKGGGFGMFSAIEQRRLLVHIAHGSRCLSDSAQFPTSLLRAFDRCAHHPTRGCLDDIATELSGGSWRYYFNEPLPDSRVPPLKVIPARRLEALGTKLPFPARHDRVVVEVWRFLFDVGEDGGRPSVRAVKALDASTP